MVWVGLAKCRLAQVRTESAQKAHDCAAPIFHKQRTAASRSTSCGGIVEGMDGREWYDENG